jgi:hypothetical protein
MKAIMPKEEPKTDYWRDPTGVEKRYMENSLQADRVNGAGGEIGLN